MPQSQKKVQKTGAKKASMLDELKEGFTRFLTSDDRKRKERAISDMSQGKKHVRRK